MNASLRPPLLIIAWLLATCLPASAAPYPPSTLITEVTWAPTNTIIRLAPGGDNWPITWGDDDALYSAYGDGNGFKPFVPKKLSMGIVKVLGTPPDIQGINIPSPMIESYGGDKRGHKASGMLMVDGILYLAARNRTNSQIAFSRDHGFSWEWTAWRFTNSFGYPNFLNFGANYAGARDGFVYVYSHDTDSAYDASDNMVLARVPKGKITELAAYENFRGIGASGEAEWSKDIGMRKPVFMHAGRCQRGGVTYSPALKRYLWCQIHPDSKHPQGPRFEGGFGIYEAPEPWGPWRTVYYTEAWDVGPGETSSLPTKWMSADGKTMWLLFSGDDCFALREVKFGLGRDNSK